MSKLTLDMMPRLLSEVLSRPKEDLLLPELCGEEKRKAAYYDLVCQVGTRYKYASFANYKVYEEVGTSTRKSQREVYQAVRDFCDNMTDRMKNGGGLVLTGPPGTGKDHLIVTAMYWAILKYGLTVTWRDGPMLAQEIRSVIAGNNDETAFIDKFVKPQIFVISDPVPPKGDASNFVTDTLQRIVDRRYRMMKSTWCTLNVGSAKEADQRLAAPLVDRLRHDSLHLGCGWNSYRKRDK